MKKSEILQAIDSTITSNNKKGISGDSLANILREITNVAGDGNGGGGGGVNAFVFKIPLFVGEAVSTIFGEEPMIAWNKYVYDLSIDAIAEMMQEELGIENYLETPIHQALLDSIEHNERVISELIEHYRNGQTVSNIKVDVTPGLKEAYEIMYGDLDIFGIYEMSFSYEAIMAEEAPIADGVQAISILGAGQHRRAVEWNMPPSIAISSIPNLENLPEEYIEYFSMTHNMVCLGYQIDYSLPVVYINNGNTSEDNVSSNKMFYGTQHNGYFDTQISLIYNENLTKKVGVFGVYIEDENSPYYYSSYFIEGLTVNKLTVTDDGIATVTVVGTLTEENEAVAVATYGRSVSETATFYIKETGVLTEDEKNHNAESYQMLKNHEAKSVTAIALGDDDSAMFIPCTASVSNTDLITLMIASADADLKPVFTIFTVNASGEITQQQK
jgi:hypothetical protein